MQQRQVETIREVLESAVQFLLLVMMAWVTEGNKCLGCVFPCVCAESKHFLVIGEKTALSRSRFVRL